MKEYELEEDWSPSFYPLLKCESRYLVMCGGRGSGKSEFAARKIFRRCVEEGGHRFLVLRKVRSRCRESVVEVFRRLLISHAVPFEETKTERTLRFFGNEILFDGLDDPQKIKSFAGVTGIWIEEATEFSEADFLGVDLILREPTPNYKQIILTFNPEEALAPWLKRRFFDAADPDAAVHTSTIDDNPIKDVRDAYRARLDLIQDKTARDIYRFGIWAQAKGIIYGWDVVAAPPERPDEVFYGGDFGYSVDPAVVIKIYRKADEYWVEQLIYQTGVNNRRLGDLMRESGIGKYDAVYFDSAEPKSIDDLIEMGFAVRPSMKGQDSVRAGIDFLKSLKIHIVEGSDKIIDECRRYHWREDRDGNPLPEPVKFDDHTMDAIRYGIVTHAKASGAAYVGFSKESVY